MATTKATNLGHRSDVTLKGTTTTIETDVVVSDTTTINNAGDDVGLKINSTSTGNIMQLQDSGTDVMVVKDGGNVGIGCSPARPFQVEGFGHFGTASAGVTIGDNSGVASVYGLDAAGATYKPFEIRTGASGTGFYQNTSGNVGIGTSTPNANAKLHVYQGNFIAQQTSGNVFVRLIPQNNNTSYITFGDSVDENNGLISYQNASSLSDDVMGFQVGNSRRVTITGDGNVGIGTTDPTSDGDTTLEVYGGNTPTLRLNDGGQYKSLMQLRGNDTEIRGSSGKIEFYTGNDDGASSTHRLSIDNIGRIFFHTYADATNTSFSTNASANLYIGTGSDNGVIYRSTSSRIFKTNIVDTAKGLKELLTLRPRDFNSLCEPDDKDMLRTGFIAEEVDDAGFDEYIQRGTNGEVYGVNYAHMVALCVKAIQELSAKVTALENATN